MYRPTPLSSATLSVANLMSLSPVRRHFLLGLIVLFRAGHLFRVAFVTGIFPALVLTLSIHTTQAGSATWDLNPGSGDWNTATNWTPTTVPNGPADTAFFDLSNTTALSISANTEVNGIVFDSNAGLNAFTITASPSFTLTISGVGITNNSGSAQNFVAAPSATGVNALRLLFNNSATAGSETFFTMNGGATFGGTPGRTLFDDSSSASHGTFTNNGPTVQGTFGGGGTLFNNSATASNGTFINNGGTVGSQFGGDQGFTNFNDTSTAADGIFTNNAATVSGAHGGTTAFGGSATAANGTFVNKGAFVTGAGNGFNSGSGMTRFFNASTAANGTFTNDAATVSGSDGGFTEFHDASTAANGTLTNNGATVSGAGGGFTYFYDTSTAGNATLIANGGMGGGQGGTILFEDNSSGGTSRVEVLGNSSLDISPHNAPSQRFPGVPIGSIEGDGNVFLGVNNMAVGSNNMNTTFSGVIQDGGQNGGTGGSLTKIGTGTLVLSGSNTYTGNTNVNAGVLQVDGSITSNTFVNHFGTLSGTGTVNGNVTNGNVTNHLGGTVSPGDAPGTLTVNGNYTQSNNGTLLIDIAGPNTGQFSILDVLGNANLNRIALLLPVLENGFVPTVGESFTFMDYSALTGTFSIFDRNIDNVMEHWDITYQPKDAILTVAPGNVPVPDQASTLLLLTLSLLGLVTYRHGLPRKQA
jgi:autotransporter-associated beta strand protein